MKTARILMLSIVLTLTGAAAFSQSRTPGTQPDARQREEGDFAPGGPPAGERREEVRRKIESLRIWRLTEELKLDAATSGKLSALLSPLDQKRRELQRGQVETMRALRQQLATQKPDEAKIKPLLDRLESNQRTMQELRSAELKAVREVLTMEQQARFLIFQLDFEREMREMISNARRGGPRGGPRGEGPGRFQDR